MTVDGHIQLGKFRFDPDRKALVDGNGDLVALRRQTLEVLDILCARSGEVVPKSEIYDAVWGDTAVTDGSLVQCIKEIRRVLGDDDFELVQTFPRQGYRVAPSQGTRKNESSHARPVILVIPFDFGGAEFDPEFNLTGALIGFLSQYPELSVVSRQTSMGLRGSSLIIRDIAEQTGADYVVSGYLQTRAGEDFLAVELLDALGDRNVWTGLFSLESSGQPEVMPLIAERITTAVGYLTTSFAPPSLGSGSPSALAHHLEARTEVQKQTRASIDRAEDLNLQAIAADPATPFGYIGLGFVHYMRHEFGFWDQEGDPLNAADEYANKAIDIAPGNSTALFLRGVVNTSMGRQEDAVACLERALQLTPNNASIRVAYSVALLYIGDAQEALTQSEIVAQRAVEFPTWHLRSRALIFWAMGRHEEALNCLHRDPTLPDTALPLRAVVLVNNNRINDAQAAIAALRRADPAHSLGMERAIWGRKFRKRRHTENWLNALRQAGLPESV